MGSRLGTPAQKVGAEGPRALGSYRLAQMSRRFRLADAMAGRGVLKGRFMQWIFIGALAYLAVLLVIFVFQRSLLYPGARDKTPLGPLPPGFHEVTTTPEPGPTPGIVLRHWYRPPANPKDPVIVVFHGNAGHIGDRAPKMAPLIEAGFGIFLVGYRGYGNNPGKPSEAGLSADAYSALDLLADEGVTPDRLVLYGESLGTAVAVKMANERPVAAVVLEAPPSSIAAVAQAHYWYLPARWLVLDQWDSIGRIASISAPLLLLHGGQDRVVPQRFGKRLFGAAVEPKKGIFVPEAGHTNLLEFPAVTHEVVDFIRAAVPQD